MHDVAQVVTFVGVDPAQQHQHPVRADPQRQHLAAVALRAGRGEAGQLGHRDDGGGVAQLLGGRRPARSEDDGDVVAFDAGAVGQGPGRLLRGVPRDRPRPAA